MSQKSIDMDVTSIIDFCIEKDLLETINRVDPLCDKGCHYLDGACDCKSIDDCKYLKDKV